MQLGLRSGNKLANLEPDENYDINAGKEVIVDEDVLNRSYESKVSEAAADFANGSPRNVSSIKSFPFIFCRSLTRISFGSIATEHTT